MEAGFRRCTTPRSATHQEPHATHVPVQSVPRLCAVRAHSKSGVVRRVVHCPRRTNTCELHPILVRLDIGEVRRAPGGHTEKLPPVVTGLGIGLLVKQKVLEPTAIRARGLARPHGKVPRPFSVRVRNSERRK